MSKDGLAAMMTPAGWRTSMYAEGHTRALDMPTVPGCVPGQRYGYPVVRCCARAQECAQAGCPSGQWERTVNPSRKLRRFESFTRHTVQYKAPHQPKRQGGALLVSPAMSSNEQPFTGSHGE